MTGENTLFLCCLSWGPHIRNQHFHLPLFCLILCFEQQDHDVTFFRHEVLSRLFLLQIASFPKMSKFEHFEVVH